MRRRECEFKANPSCNLSWDPPTTALVKTGIVGGVRAPGDPANVEISIHAAEFAGQSLTLIDRHSATGRTETAAFSLDANGQFLTKVTDPVPGDWPLGEWEVLLQFPDGTTHDCGGFRLQAERTQPERRSPVTGAVLGLLQGPVFLAIGALLLAGLILLRKRK